MDFDLSPLWISLKTAIVATGFAFIGGIGAARVMLVYQGRWRGVLDGILTMPLILPPTVVGFGLLLILGNSSPLGQLLEVMGITIIFSWAATVIASTVVAFPLMYKTVLGAFRQVDPDLLNCSRTLGASENRVFWQLLLPLAWPGVVAGTILAFARALGEFGATLMLAGSIPGRTQTMPIAIFFAGEAGHLGEALFWTVVLGSIALSAIVLINYVSEEALTDNRWVERPLIKQIAAKLQQWFTILGRWRQRHSNGSLNDTGLVVDLEKKLSNLTVVTQCTVGDRPLAILGASGAGKSTILRCVAGLVTPDRGRIVLNGRVLFDADQGINLASAERHVGFVFQNYALFPHMRVVRNIGFGLQHLPRQERQERVEYYLKLLQLDGLEHHYPHQLSGGQQQRVALARVLATNPEVLLLDEPLSALDSYLRDRVETSLVNLFSTYQGVVLLVTHNLEEAYRLCDRWLILSHGQTIAYGRKQDIFEQPPNTITAQLTECKNIAAAEAVGAFRVCVLGWNNCILTVAAPLPTSPFYVGIRAHHVQFLAASKGDYPKDMRCKRLDQPTLNNRPNTIAVLFGDETTPDHHYNRPDPHCDHHREDNCLPCWPVFTSETQHRVTVYLHLGDRPPGATGPHAPYHLQAELPKEVWLQMKLEQLPGTHTAMAVSDIDQPPLWVRLDALRLIVMPA